MASLPTGPSRKQRAALGARSGFLLGLLLATAATAALASNNTQRVLAAVALLGSGLGLTWSLHRDEATSKFERERRLNDLLLSPTLAGRDLTGGDLAGAVLRSRSFDASSLRKAKLTGADLTYASMRKVDLRGAVADQATLLHADLALADLGGADLSGADLRHTDLTGATLEGANLVGADLRDAQLAGANLRGADLTGALVQRTGLQDASYDATTKLPYSLTSELRRVQGLKPSTDATKRLRQPRARRPLVAPGFALAAFAGLLLTGGLAGVSAKTGVGTPAFASQTWPWQNAESSAQDRTRVLGAGEQRLAPDRRSLIIEAKGTVVARFEFFGGELLELEIVGDQRIDGSIVQKLERLTLRKVDGDRDVSTIACTLVRDSNPEDVRASAKEVVCPLE